MNCALNSKALLVLSLFINSINCYNNVTDKYMQIDEEQLMKGRFLGGHGKPRFLTFQTNEDDISIEMQLSVPFLTIPVKKSVNSATGLMEKFKPANINLAALGLAGTMVFAASFVLPSILKLFSIDHITKGGMFGRVESGGYEWMGDFSSRFGRVLETRGASPSACISRALCWIVRHSVDASEKGKPNSSDKIIDGLASNEWIMGMLKDTALSKAIEYGYLKENCSVMYPECKINQNVLQSLAKTLTKIFNT